MQAGAVHHLPIATTFIAAAFLVVLCRRSATRGWTAPHAWWAVGVFTFGLGTLFESIITLRGNTLLLNRLWYWSGAILGAYPLATGSVYLLLPRRWAHGLTVPTLGLVLVATVAVFLTPLDASALQEHRPSGDVIGWTWIRALTPAINGYAALFLVGGAAHSSVQFFRRGGSKGRAFGTLWIAVGALLPGIGGAMAKGGLVEALYVGELIGLALIWLGYERCARTPAPVTASRASPADPA